jgi:hypothetical protein
MHSGVVADVIASIERQSGVISHDPTTDLLTVNGEFTTAIVIARCLTTSAGSLRWKLRLDTGLRPDITVGLRMDAQNREPLDYYLLPRIDISAPKIRLAEDNGIFLDAYRFDSLDYFSRLASRIAVRVAA